MGWNAGATFCYRQFNGDLLVLDRCQTEPMGAKHRPEKWKCDTWTKNFDSKAEAEKALLDKVVEAVGKGGVVYDPEVKFVGPGKGAGTTQVTADVYQGTNYVTGVDTSGGRQFLNTQNGALDLRWHVNQSMVSGMTEVSGKFAPAGKWGSFGYLKWLVTPFSGSGIDQREFFSAENGVRRNQVLHDDTPADKRDPNTYRTQTAPYYKYDGVTAAYFWYKGGPALDVPHYVETIRNERGYCLYYNYDQNDKLISITGATGQLTPYFGYDDGHRIDRMYLQDNESDDHRSTYYQYDGDGALAAIEEPDSVVTYFSMSGSDAIFTTGGRVVREMDPEGYVTYLWYDSTAEDRLDVLDLAGRVTYFEDQGMDQFGDQFAMSSSRRASGWQRQYYRRNAGGHGIKLLSGTMGGSHTYYGYDSNNIMTSERDANGNLTLYEVNELNLRTKETYADGSTKEMGYDATGRNVVRTTGPRHSASNPQVTYFAYTETGTGQPTQVLDPLLRATYFGYDDRQRLVKTLNPRGGSTYFGFDVYGRINAAQDTLGNATYYAYNANAQKTREMDPLLRTTYYTHDKLDQVKTQESPTGSMTSYARDKRGLPIREGRSDGSATYHAYDAYKNPVRTAELSDDGFVTTYFEYDDEDGIVRVTDPRNNETLFGYDRRSRHLRTQNAENAVSYFVYDPNGNRSHTRDANGNWIETVYDEVNRASVVKLGVNGLHAPSETDVEGHWNLNETSGNRSDDSGNGYELSDPMAAVSYGTGWIGNAALFDASNQDYLYVDTIQPGLEITGSLTLAAWIKLNSLPATDEAFTVAGKGDYGESYKGYRFQVVGTADGVGVQLDISQDGSASDTATGIPSIPIETGRWHHVAGTFRPASGGVDGEMIVYVDGVPVTHQPTSLTSIYDNEDYFMAGASSAYVDPGPEIIDCFDGYMDELYVYATELSQTGISRLAQQYLDVTFDAQPLDVIAAYYEYDGDDNLTVSVDGRENATYYGFDLVNRQVASLDALENSAYYGYDASDNLTATLNPRGYATYYGYDLASRQTRTLNALNQASYFGYDAVGNRTAAQYPCGEVEYFGYDGSDRLVANLDRGGFASYFGYDSGSRLIRDLSTRGYSAYYGYDLLSRPVTALDALGQAAYFGYDSAGNQTRVLDHISSNRSAATYFGYDDVNRLVRHQDALLRTYYFEYDAVGNQLEISMPGSPRRTAQSGYDKYNRIVRSVAPTGSITYFGHDAASNLTTALNARGCSSYFGYDALNRLDRNLDALNGSAYFGYDCVGNTVRQLDQLRNSTYFGYDALNRSTRTLDALGAATYFGYDAAGNLFSALPARGGASYYYYDARNLLDEAVDGEGNSTLFDYDAAGNQTRVSTKALGYGQQAYGITPYGEGERVWTQFGYDALNRLTRVLDAEDGTAYFGFDVAGNTVRIQDALDRPTYFAYDLLDRLTTVMDAVQNTMYFGYDLAGNRSTEMDALLHSSYFGYDVGNRLCATLDPLKAASYYAYDANSNLVATQDNNQSVVYFGYDALDRRSVVKYSSEAQYFGYDAMGNLLASMDGWGTSYYGYDELSRLTRRDTPRGDIVLYDYDAVSNLATLQYPNNPEPAAKYAYYGYDDAQRMTRVQNPYGNTTYYEYDNSSVVLRKTFANETVCHASYDKTNRVTSLRYVKYNGDTIAYFDYGRDVAGRITKIERENDLSIYYSYDDIDRLTGEVWRKTSDLSQIYAFWYDYDAANNRTKMRRESTTGTETESAYYWYDAANALTERTVYPGPVNTYYYYDANGALTKEWDGSDATYFEYGDNQLISKITPPPAAGNPWHFWYDARSDRYAIDKGGTVSYYLCDGLNPLEERDTSGDPVSRYTAGYSPMPGIGSVPDVRRDAGGTTYYQYLVMDHRGTVHKATDSNGNADISYTLDAFGRELSSPTGDYPETPNDLVYQSNWQSFQIGGRWWCVSKYRLYDPETGAFVSRDFLPYINKYRCWSNDPVGQVDKDGLWSAIAVGGGGGVLRAVNNARELMLMLPATRNRPYRDAMDSFTAYGNASLEALRESLGSGDYQPPGMIPSRFSEVNQTRAMLEMDEHQQMVSFVESERRYDEIYGPLQECKCREKEIQREIDRMRNAPVLGRLQDLYSRGGIFRFGANLAYGGYRMAEVVTLGGFGGQDLSIGDYYSGYISRSQNWRNWGGNMVRATVGGFMTFGRIPGFSGSRGARGVGPRGAASTRGGSPGSRSQLPPGNYTSESGVPFRVVREGDQYLGPDVGGRTSWRGHITMAEGFTEQELLEESFHRMISRDTAWGGAMKEFGYTNTLCRDSFQFWEESLAKLYATRSVSAAFRGLQQGRARNIYKIDYFNLASQHALAGLFFGSLFWYAKSRSR